jgi:hypothetical protein
MVNSGLKSLALSTMNAFRGVALPNAIWLPEPH